MPIETCILTLHKDGTFDAVDVPLVMDFYPELKLKYTTEQGTWKLVDNEAKDTRSRWKLALSFNQTRFGIDWNIIKSANGFELFETTDLDMWMVGYKFRHQ